MRLQIWSLFSSLTLYIGIGTVLSSDYGGRRRIFGENGHVSPILPRKRGQLPSQPVRLLQRSSDGWWRVYLPFHLGHSWYDAVTIDSYEIAHFHWHNAHILNHPSESSVYDSMRPIAYPGTHIFIICFSLYHEESFRNVKDKVWTWGGCFDCSQQVDHHSIRT